ncbi:MAG: lysyl-tRNA synthetase, class [Acidimicrobiales bacterium]|nr:lysyl-tRNA synthetase, class [Acidimicrobiales bacterium]
MTERPAIPYRFEPTATAAALQASHGGIEDGTETGEVVTVAGRLMLRRGQGKLLFGQLQDQTGRIQLFAPANVTPRFAELGALSLGDWIGVTGEVMKTRKGELSVKVTDWIVLAEARRSFPDKWHGLTDPDTRYRQRYVDLWVNDDVRRVFLLRSRLLSLTRRWLEDRGYLEVETPVFHPIPGGALARPFVTHHNALDQDLFLRIAPELYLKRLVVGGFERVFEVARVFRNEGLSPRHNPEFTMLELYEAYGDWSVHMELTEQLVAHLATELCGSTKLTYQGRDLDVSAPWRRASMSELIEEQIGRRVDLDTPIAELRALCDEHDVPWKDGHGPGKLLLELYEKTAEAAQWDPVFVTDYPQEVSPLARAHRSQAGMTERFEGIVAGRELCNGFSELVDPDDQRARFEAQARQKDAGDDEAMVVDEDYLRALDYGLPPTVGLGVGIDRLVMLLADVSSIRDVVLFPTLRPEQERGDASPADAPTEGAEAPETPEPGA